MPTITFSKKEKVLASFILVAALTRLLPHPPNFAPITGIALFSGYHFVNKRIALFIPLAVLFISDLFIGMHSLMPVIYMSFVLITAMGIYSKKLTFLLVLGASTSFFILSNLGAWYFYYPLTQEGLIQCFILALPFFANTLAGDLFYTSLLQFSFEKFIRTSLSHQN
ncbi:MAG: hypothetical protein EB076_07830 [Flavobacteriia bacterium]|nr:hypothetical protein [Flavobacteriia bacterium]